MTDKMRVTNVFREACAASPQVTGAFLAAAGFGEISKDELLVLGALVLNERGERLCKAELETDLASELWLSVPEVSRHVGALIRHGYLEPAGQQAPDLALLPKVTRRGYKAAGMAVDHTLVLRWTDFVFRPGDIVISTLPKSGTTWMQMICALLIFGSPDLPAPMPQLSPRMESAPRSRGEIYAQLAAQQHRRFIKTHISLRDIPVRPEVTYIVVARHPLDVAVSMYYQDAPLPLPPRDWLLQWLEDAASPQPGPKSLPGAMRRMSWIWAHRAPNVLLVHYQDLCTDLEGQMRRLAARLGVTVPEGSWPGLVEAATLEHMRSVARDLVESGSDPATFFRRGSSGSGRELLTEAELASYHELAARLAPADLLAWLHHDPENP